MEFIQDVYEFLVALIHGIMYYLPGVGRPDRVLEFLWGHLQITLVTMFFAILIGVFAGIVITRLRVLYNPVIKLAGFLYTIPSLALFGIMIPLVGIGFIPSVIALTLYSLLTIIRNTAVGLDEIPAPVIEAARGMGMNNWQILFSVELPLALPVIFAGIRVAVVSTISLATLASYFGTISLGNLIFEGISTGGSRNDKIIAGVLGASLLAILFDRGLGMIETRLRKI
jgi:osmoprotectant transport system permease protein